jgi:hypothetical protein
MESNTEKEYILELPELRKRENGRTEKEYDG